MHKKTQCERNDPLNIYYFNFRVSTASICTATLKHLNKTEFNCSEKLTCKISKQKKGKKEGNTELKVILWGIEGSKIVTYTLTKLERYSSISRRQPWRHTWERKQMLGLFTLSGPEPSGQNKDKSPCSASWHWKTIQASGLTWLYNSTHKYAVKQINIK